MKKTISVILILVLLFCSVYGFTFVEFTGFLDSITSKISDFSDSVFGRLYFVFNEQSHLFITGGKTEEGTDGFVKTYHENCYLKYIRDAGFSVELDQYLDGGNRNILVDFPLYECKIKTGGEWYHTYLIKYGEVSMTGKNYFIIVDCEYSDFNGEYFQLNSFLFVGDYAMMGMAMRDIKNLKVGDKSLSDIEHNCVAEN